MSKGAQDRYNQSAKGKAAQKRHRSSLKGKTSRKQANARWEDKKKGLTPEVRAALLARGTCGACGATEPGSKHGWSMDHCHDPVKFRDMLCHPCNVTLGLLKEDPDRLHALLRYLEKHHG